MSERHGIGRASALLASGSIVSRALGFARIAVLAAAIGVVGSPGADAYQTATIVPNSIYAIIGGGLLTAVLVPQIVRASRDADGGAGYINKLTTIALIGLGAVAIVATALSPVLMQLFGVRGDALPLATAFAFWSLPQIFFLGLYTVLGEVLNARRSFGPFTWAPVLNNVVALATLGSIVLLFGANPGRSVQQYSPGLIALLAGGATLGIAAQALVLTLAWRRAGLTYRPDFRWRGVNLGATGRAGAWTFGMLIATQVAGAVETNIANIAAGTSSVAVMSTSWLIFMLPHGIITVSLITVFYPRMSEHAASGDLAAVRADVAQAVRILLLVVVAADAALLVAALPFARFFTDSAAQAGAMAAVLIGYLVGLLPFTLLFVVQRAFYSLADTRTPFLFTMAQVVVIVAGVLACSALPTGAIAAGIALVVTLATTIQLAIAAVLLRRRLGGLGGRPVVAATARYLLAGAVAAGVGVVLLILLGGFDDGFAVASKGLGLLTTALIGLTVAVVYTAVLLALKSPELGVAIDLIKARIAPTVTPLDRVE
ncbi:murein biosynthesis integral membrane protein MurJ [uncultured Amnibacterium sp.]|uniref:murein biosynthesis integral membrane protein MurJ n=1 Tax=uncultured Amnibacterium sp. TaxID=1631851 RepID=UPI0035C96982